MKNRIYESGQDDIYHKTVPYSGTETISLVINLVKKLQIDHASLDDVSSPRSSASVGDGLQLRLDRRQEKRSTAGSEEIMTY